MQCMSHCLHHLISARNKVHADVNAYSQKQLNYEMIRPTYAIDIYLAK